MSVGIIYVHSYCSDESQLSVSVPRITQSGGISSQGEIKIWTLTFSSVYRWTGFFLQYDCIVAQFNTGRKRKVNKCKVFTFFFAQPTQEVPRMYSADE